MANLTRGDLEQLLRFIAEAESIGGDQPFTPDLLGELGHLVEADLVTYCELDRVRRRSLLVFVGRADDGDDDVEFDDETLWRVSLEEHPVVPTPAGGSISAQLKLSDFLTQRELHRTWVYDAWFARWDAEYELVVAIPSPLWHTKTFLFDRTRRP